MAEARRYHWLTTWKAINANANKPITILLGPLVQTVPAAKIAAKKMAIGVLPRCFVAYDATFPRSEPMVTVEVHYG